MGLIAAGVGSPATIYMRAHKREPYMVLSIAIGILMPLTSWLLVRPFGTLGIAIATCAVSLLVTLPTTLLIFFHCRAKWHRQDLEEIPMNASYRELASRSPRSTREANA